MKNSRYGDVLTRDFFEKEYIQNRKSVAQLAKETGIYWATIKTYALSSGIRLRSHKEQAAFSSIGAKRKYDELLTKDFFFHYYVNPKISITDLSSLTGINWHVLNRYMQRLGIPVRPNEIQIPLSYPPKEFEVNGRCEAFFDGLLLGDGSIPSRASGSRSFSQACKHKEYLEYIKRRAERIGVTCSPILTRWTKDLRCKRGGYSQSFLQSHRYKTFEAMRKRWYKGGIKRVPRDLKFTPDCLLQWYLCDGSFYREIYLCTDAFPTKDISLLQNLFRTHLGIETRTKRVASGFELIIRKSDCQKFLSYIGPSPVGCYRYKWSDGETEEAKIRKRRLARERYHGKKGS